MKKVINILMPIIAIALLSGCAKERDNYDKYLTSGTWTLSTYSFENNQARVKNYVLAATPDETTTSLSTTKVTGGKATDVDFNQTAYTPGSTTFSRTTTISNYSTTLEFNKDGTVKYTQSTQVLSRQSDTHLGNGPVINISSSPATSSISFPWTWANGTETKQLLNMYALGVFEVSIKKNQLVLTKISTRKSSNNGSDGLGDYAYTEDNSDNTIMTFTK